jgi:hypothetical protein
MRNKTMRHEYDIFERFPDGSSIWRATMLGRYEAQRKMQELAEYSENMFFTTDIQTGQHLPFNLPDRDLWPVARARAASG